MNRIETLVAAMRSIVDEAEGRDLSSDEVAAYEKLETELAAARNSNELRARQNAYEMPVLPGAYAAPRAEVDEREVAFDRYLRGDKGAEAELRSQTVGTPSEGGFLVPDGFRSKLVEVRKAFGGLQGVVENISTATGQPLEWPSLNDTANEGNITAEGSNFAGGADLVFGTVTLGAYKYTSAGANNEPLKVSYELLQDSEFDVRSLVARKLGERISRRQATDWAVGSGSGEPKGILDTSSDVKLVTDSDLSDAANGYEKLLEVEAALDPAYEDGAVWVMNKKAWMQVRAIVDGDERPLIQANAEAGIGTRPMRTLLGYPVILDNSFPDPADDTVFAVFGRLSEAYVIRRVSGLAVVVNPFTSASSGQVEFTAWERADANIQNRAAYVTLAGKDS